MYNVAEGIVVDDGGEDFPEIHIASLRAGIPTFVTMFKRLVGDDLIILTSDTNQYDALWTVLASLGPIQTILYIGSSNNDKSRADTVGIQYHDASKVFRHKITRTKWL
jgi:hypothetical protein